ncbi:hypothetical protein Syun_003140 [Stephania yunnanensis]|uniref:DYW domain-containing protein n=1 Tax=Stephania yunnanensis TaxID=152371 RepID=A0AAP0L0P3_9MAGN
MRAITGVVSVSHYFSTSKHLQILSFSGTKAELVELEEEEEEEKKNLYFRALDGYPDLFTLKRLHSEIVSNRSLKFNPCLVIKLMRAFAALGDADTTCHMFDEFPRKNVIFYNVMIRSYVNNNMYYNALVLYASMLGSGIRPDNYTFPCVLKACSGCENLRVGLQTHLCIEGWVYAKCDLLCDARCVLDGMRRKDVVSWNSMLAVFARNGRFDEGLEVCREMELLSFKPDKGTLASLSPAITNTSAANVGFVSEMFNKMPKKSLLAWLIFWVVHGVLMKHITLLRRCLWNQMKEYYVLLSNIYAKAGRWEEVTAVRSIMKSKGIKKLPGYSNVELGDRVHTFLVGDRSHPQSNEIYAELDVLVSKMKENGYVPEMDSALHDVEDEDKENHLVVHSEKLAIAFVIINTKPGTAIRITKNLRVCGDCHIAAKHISKIAKREIIIRDTNRFHHFKGGLCSCGDYW